MGKKKFTYKLKEIERLKNLAFDMELDNAEILNNYSLDDLRLMANGIGSESMPKWSRKTVSALNPSLEAVALIHDIEWSGLKKTREHFKETNKRFKGNGYLAAVYCRAWYDPRRYLVMNTARRFANICQLLGWKAYLTGKRVDYEEHEAEISNDSIDD